MNTSDIKALWRTLPLAKNNDLQKLDEQIERRPQTWQAVAEWLQKTDFNALPLGRNEIGEGAYANVAEYETKLKNVYELHRRYIDVQLLGRGEETVYVADKEDALEPQGEFNVEGDCILYAGASRSQGVVVSPESYQIFFPSDAHMPCMAVGNEPQPVRKICVKVPFEEI